MKKESGLCLLILLFHHLFTPVFALALLGGIGLPLRVSHLDLVTLAGLITCWSMRFLMVVFIHSYVICSTL